jgi:DNA replication protein
MPAFAGFEDSIKVGVFIPEVFITRVLPLMTSLDEVRVCLQFFRLLKGDADAFLSLEEVLNEESADDITITKERVSSALTQACEHGVLQQIIYQKDTYYFINSPRSRAIKRANEKGAWIPGAGNVMATRTERPNIYTLYEQNIGPLTPMISQILADAENTYPAGWLEDAVQIAVKKNVRNWNYVEAILRSWKENGRNETDRRNDQENPRRYIEGDLADYIKH